jgi:hypothetical protein
VGCLAQLVNANTTTRASARPFTMFFMTLPPFRYPFMECVR